MKTEDLKNILHEGIENSDNRDVLFAVKELLERKYSGPIPPRLSKDQLRRVKHSRQQFKVGESYSREESDALIDQWLRK